MGLHHRVGRLLDQRNAARAYQRALAAAGVDVRARFHLFRHSAASAMLASGAVSVRTVSEVLGHSSTSITADTYGTRHGQREGACARRRRRRALRVNRRPNCRPITGEAPSQ